MKKLLTAIVLALLMAGCGGGSNTAIRGDDVLQFRRLLDEDPLAIKANMPDGTEVVLGDVLLTDRGIQRVAVDPNPEEGFDLELVLSDRERARLEEFWFGRRSDRQLVLILDNQPWRIIGSKSMIKENRIYLPNVAPTEEQASELADRIVLWKQERKKKNTD